MSYPMRAYRNNASNRAAGYQSGLPKASRPTKPIPANDNDPLPRRPKPANDNFRIRTPSPFVRKHIIRRAGQIRNPWSLAYKTIVHLYRYNEGINELPANSYDGSWQLKGHCDNPPKPTGPPRARVASDPAGPNSNFHNFADSCLALQANTGPLFYGYVVPSGRNILTKDIRYTLPPLDRYTIGDSWYRPISSVPAAVPVPHVRNWPAIDPAYWNDPIKYPPGYRQPLPNRPINNTGARPHPASSPTESTQRGYGVDQAPTPSAPPPTRKPPGPGVKERKTKVTPFVSISLGLVNFVGEGIDALQAVHDALPEKYQSKSPKPQDMAKAVYLHYDKINIGIAIMNLAIEQAEDHLYGVIGNANREASRNFFTGDRRGFMTGPAL